MKGNEMETVFFVKEELMESDYEDPLETDNIAKGRFWIIIYNIWSFCKNKKPGESLKSKCLTLTFK